MFQMVAKWMYIYIYIYIFPERFPLSWYGNSNMFQMVAKWIYIYIYIYIFPECFPLSWYGNSNMFQMVAKWIYIYIYTYIYFSGALPVILVWKQQHVSNGCKMDIYIYIYLHRYFFPERFPLSWYGNSNMFQMVAKWIYTYIFFRGASRYLGMETATCFKWLQNGYIYIHIYINIFPERFPLSWYGNSNMFQMVAKWIYMYIYIHI